MKDNVAPASSIETITPLRAQEYLKRNLSNRSVIATRVNYYAGMMAAGEWPLNGEPILFDIYGNLLDGQHRLLACVHAGVPFTTFVTRGLLPTVMPTLNTGKARSAGDAIAILGGPNGRLVAGTVTWLLKYKRGQILTATTSFPHAEIVKFWQTNEKTLAESLKIRRITGRLLMPGVACGFHFLFAERDRVAADELFDDVGIGASLTITDPVYILREQLVANGINKIKLPGVEQAARLVRAWNHRRMGTTTKLLRGTYGMGTSRVFPEIV